MSNHKSTQVLSDLLQAHGSFQTRELAAAERDSKAEALSNLNELAAANWGDPAWHREQAAIIIEALDWGLKSDNVFGTYMPIRTLGKTEQLIIKERRGLKAFWTHRAGEIDESQIRTDTFEVPRDTIGWHVREFEDNVQANYAETIAELIPLGRLREETEINRRIFELVNEAVPEGSEYYEDASASALAPAIVNAALAAVRDVPQPSNVSLRREATIVGRASAIDRIFDFPGYAEVAQEELRKTGRLGRYRGANIVALENWQDDDGDPFVPEDELYVFGGNVGTFAYFGAPTLKMWTENKVPYTHFQTRRDVGGSVYHPEALRRIKLQA